MKKSIIIGIVIVVLIFSGVLGYFLFFKGDGVMLAPKTGTLYVSSTPSGASVYLDGVLKGLTPKAISGLSLKNYNITISKSGYQNFFTVKKIVAGSNYLNVTLVPVAQTGTLYISSIPSDAKVFVDGAPKNNTPVTISGLAIGSHRIEVWKQGYESYYDAAKNIVAGNNSLNVTLVPIAQTGTLYITSIPSDADVYLDGSPRNKTPVIIDGLNLGTYYVLISKAGYNDSGTHKTIVAGNNSLNVILIPL